MAASTKFEKTVAKMPTAKTTWMSTASAQQSLDMGGDFRDVSAGSCGRRPTQSRENWEAVPTNRSLINIQNRLEKTAWDGQELRRFLTGSLVMVWGFGS